MPVIQWQADYLTKGMLSGSWIGRSESARTVFTTARYEVKIARQAI